MLGFNMKGHLSIIKYYPDNNRMEGFGVGLIICTDNGEESYIKISNPRIKRINSAFGFKKSKLLELAFEDYLSQNFDIKSLKYLSAYENGNLRFTEPQVIVTDNLKNKFEDLYKKYIADYNELEYAEAISMKKNIPQKIGRKLRSNFRRNSILNSHLNIGFNFKDNSVSKFLIGNPRIDFIGGNGSIFCGEIINLEVEEESVQKNLNKTITLFDAIKETYSSYNKFESKDCQFLVLKEHADNKDNAEYMEKLSTWSKKVGYELLIKDTIADFEEAISKVVEEKRIIKYEDWVKDLELQL